jgi:DNA-binding MarR family transcriptional regulator
MPKHLRKIVSMGARDEDALGPDEAARIGIFRLVLVVAQAMRTRMDELLRPDGLTTQQAALITVVERLDSPSLTQAALSLGTTHQNLRQVADALVRKGFLSIEPDAGDGRVRRLVTTPKSDEYWGRTSPASHRRVLDWFESFSDDEVRTLSGLLWRLEENMRAADDTAGADGESC